MKILLLVSLIILFLYILPRYKKPRVIKGFITDEERSYIIRSAEGKLEESRVTQGKIVDVTQIVKSSKFLNMRMMVIINPTKTAL